MFIALHTCIIVSHIHDIVVQHIYYLSLWNKTCQLVSLEGIGWNYSYFATDNTVIFPNINNFYDNHLCSNWIIFQIWCHNFNETFCSSGNKCFRTFCYIFTALVVFIFCLFFFFLSFNNQLSFLYRMLFTLLNLFYWRQ